MKHQQDFGPDSVSITGPSLKTHTSHTLESIPTKSASPKAGEMTIQYTSEGGAGVGLGQTIRLCTDITATTLLTASPTTMISNTSLASTSDITMQLPSSLWLIVETYRMSSSSIAKSSPRCCQPTLQSESVILPTSTTSPESSPTPVDWVNLLLKSLRFATDSLFTRRKSPRR